MRGQSVKRCVRSGSLYGLVTIASIMSLGIAGCNGTHHSSASPIATAEPVPAPPPLIEATLVGNVDEVRSRLESGTDPNLVYRTNTALTYAARDGFAEIAQLLIDAGADVNWIDGEGVTPLILASFKGHLDLVQLLLEHEADVTVRDQWDQTALDYALRRGEEDTIAKLLQMSQ